MLQAESDPKGPFAGFANAASCGVRLTAVGDLDGNFDLTGSRPPQTVVNAPRGLRIEATGGPVPKTGRLYLTIR